MNHQEMQVGEKETKQKKSVKYEKKRSAEKRKSVKVAVLRIVSRVIVKKIGIKIATVKNPENAKNRDAMKLPQSEKHARIRNEKKKRKLEVKGILRQQKAKA